MKLVDTVVRSFGISKFFCEDDQICNIDFSANGEFLISSRESCEIIIYDCIKGIRLQTIMSKKYGVDLIHFTHAKNSVIYCSTKVNDDIRYLSLFDNKFLRYFQGHTERVVTLCMSPIDDTFASASLDKTIRLWDLRSPNPHAIIQMPPGQTVGSFDPDGLIFAAGCGSELIKLYDLRALKKGPFVTFKFPQEKECNWTELKFSPDGKSILISTSGPIIRLIDAFVGEPLHSFTRHNSHEYIPIEASFTPDSQFVFTGSIDGRIPFWNRDTGHQACVLMTDCVWPIQHIQFNPKFMMIASGCTNMSFWRPALNETAV